VVKPPPDRSGGRGRSPRRLVAAALTLAVVVAALAGVVWLGDRARREIASRDRYTVRFDDIECVAPPGLDRPTFLAQVRYQSNFDKTFQLLDPELKAKLSAAFATHPWVAAVEDVAVDPPATVRVQMRFRVPVLAVAVIGGKDTRFVVDGGGFLLPISADSRGLPELATPVAAPAVESGVQWRDVTVRRAIELVEAYHPAKLEKAANEWRLTMPNGKVVTVQKKVDK
jgi:hypothetical protein